MNIKSIKYNWHQVGSVQDRDGCGEDYNFADVGMKGVTLIEEIKEEGRAINYFIHFENGTKQRVFNPNFVEYSAPDSN